LLEKEGDHGQAPVLGREVQRRLASPRLHGVDQRACLLRPSGPLQQHLHDLRSVPGA
jgi:hypothetical protein